MKEQDRLVQVGIVTGARGVRGDVWISSFTADPAAIAAYGPLLDARGAHPLAVRVVSVGKGKVVARISGVNDRTAAEALAGRELYVPREALPPPADEEFYYADLIGLSADAPTGEALGRVIAVNNFGAGDMLEIAPGDGRSSFHLPFTRAAVPVVDVAGGRVVVELPDGWLDPASSDPDTGGEDGGEGGEEVEP